MPSDTLILVYAAITGNIKTLDAYRKADGDLTTTSGTGTAVETRVRQAFEEIGRFPTVLTPEQLIGLGGHSLLYWACLAGQYDTAVWLVKHNKGLLAQHSTSDETPFHAACYGGHTAMAGWLLEKDAKLPHKYDVFGRTALHAACSGGHTNIAGWLLEKDPKLLHKNANDGMTPLHAACFAGHPAMVQYLVEAGIDTAAKNFFGETAYQYAKKVARTAACADYLRNYGLRQACLSGDIPQAQHWLEEGAVLTTTDNEGNSLMALACQGGSLKMVQWLIDQGVPWLNLEMDTVAERYGHSAIATYLRNRALGKDPGSLSMMDYLKQAIFPGTDHGRPANNQHTPKPAPVAQTTAPAPSATLTVDDTTKAMLVQLFTGLAQRRGLAQRQAWLNEQADEVRVYYTRVLQSLEVLPALPVSSLLGLTRHDLQSDAAFVAALGIDTVVNAAEGLLPPVKIITGALMACVKYAITEADYQSQLTKLEGLRASGDRAQAERVATEIAYSLAVHRANHGSAPVETSLQAKFKASLKRRRDLAQRATDDVKAIVIQITQHDILEGLYQGTSTTSEVIIARVLDAIGVPRVKEDTPQMVAFDDVYQRLSGQEALQAIEVAKADFTDALAKNYQSLQEQLTANEARLAKLEKSVAAAAHTTASSDESVAEANVAMAQLRVALEAQRTQATALKAQYETAKAKLAQEAAKATQSLQASVDTAETQLSEKVATEVTKLEQAFAGHRDSLEADSQTLTAGQEAIEALMRQAETIAQHQPSSTTEHVLVTGVRSQLTAMYKETAAIFKSCRDFRSFASKRLPNMLTDLTQHLGFSNAKLTADKRVALEALAGQLKVEADAYDVIKGKIESILGKSERPGDFSDELDKKTGVRTELADLASRLSRLCATTTRIHGSWEYDEDYEKTINPLALVGGTNEKREPQRWASAIGVAAEQLAFWRQQLETLHDSLVEMLQTLQALPDQQPDETVANTVVSPEIVEGDRLPAPVMAAPAAPPAHDECRRQEPAETFPRSRIATSISGASASFWWHETQDPARTNSMTHGTTANPGLGITPCTGLIKLTS